MLKRVLTLVILTVSLSPALSCRPVEPLYPLEPQVLILSPTMNSVFSSGPVTVKAFTSNVKLVDKAGQDNIPGEGHLVYYLDVIPPTSWDTSAIPDEGTYAESIDLSHVWSDLAPGPHVLAVQVVTNNNTPIRYPSAVSVNITMK
jgi:hypothetical protein